MSIVPLCEDVLEIRNDVRADGGVLAYMLLRSAQCNGNELSAPVILITLRIISLALINI